ncbi:e3 ubiquitin-protein ligase PDZRN3-B [Trichonephila clavata]|uniref:E3 ubiquitin-protein ligase PDZRN3-B n=1 Tax=Trichonephila clavata TaxID=2740835 RepID=A0A8X6HWE1_TRICU|nr:e3 ubiquitin-protein ligase PDZRN3-B [Trichonephila clavata]
MTNGKLKNLALLYSMAPPLWAYQVDYFDPPPDEELICSICRSVFCDPVQSPCNHVFCRNCINKWLENNRNCPICRKRTTKYTVQEVVPLIKNMIMKLNLHCHNMEKGCEEKFPLEACEAHLKVCVYEAVRCGNKPCKEMIMRKDMPDHERNNCPHRYIRCQTCCLKVSSVQPNKHNCIKALKRRLRDKNDLIRKKMNKIKELQAEIKSLKETAEQYEQASSDVSSLESISAADIMINLPSLSSDSSFDSTNYISDSFDEDSSFGLSASDILEGLERNYNRLSEEYVHANITNDDSIEYPRSSSPLVHDHSNLTDVLDSSYNDEPQIRRPAKRRHPTRALDSSGDDNNRDLESGPIPSPKRTLWHQNHCENGHSSHAITVAMSTQPNFSDGASGSGCQPSSSGTNVSQDNALNPNAPFRLRPRLTNPGTEQTVSTASIAAPRNGSAIFERTIALLEQYNLESDPEWLPNNSFLHENEEFGSDSSLAYPVYTHITSSDESSLSDDSSDTSYEDARSRTVLRRYVCAYFFHIDY